MVHTTGLARGRWKLLRDALLDAAAAAPAGNNAPAPANITIDGHNSCSIHSFPGYQMLQSKWVDGDEPYGNEDIQALKRIMGGADYAGHTRDDWSRLIRVLQALRWRGLDITLKCNAGTVREPPVLGDMPLGWRLSELSEDGSSTVYRIQLDVAATSTTANKDRGPPPAPDPQWTDFGIKAYRCPSDCGDGDDDSCAAPNVVVTYIHERRRRRTTLQDLVRHRTTGIDNTGSVCVWDAAQTLAWYLCCTRHGLLLEQTTTVNNAVQLEQNQVVTVLELGAGMAALSSLMILQHLSERHQKKVKVVISDGQPECVENNKINCLLLESELRSRVECVLLPWSLSVSTTMPPIQATATLIADCTHFDQYHGELLWTMLYHTAVGGTIYLCQPRRGKSWSMFAALMEAVNRHAAGTVTAAPSPIVLVQQVALAELDVKRDAYESQSSTNGFRSDVHHPFLYRVKKLRTETENDKQSIVAAISIRNAT
jgi:hypothetical protein